MVDIAEIKKNFSELKSKGAVISTKPLALKNDGAVGNTFEREMHVVENNIPGPDFKQWEFKTKRQLSKSAASLFTKKPDYPKGGDEHMRINWGVPDNLKEYPKIKVLEVAAYVHRFGTYYNDRVTLKAFLDLENQKYRIHFFDKNQNLLDATPYWHLSTLKNASNFKLKNTMVGMAEETKVHGKTYFQYKKAYVYFGFDFNKFLNCMEKGIVRYEFRHGIHRTGIKKGKKHNHGGGWRLDKASNFHLLFDDYFELN